MTWCPDTEEQKKHNSLSNIGCFQLLIQLFVLHSPVSSCLHHLSSVLPHVLSKNDAAPFCKIVPHVTQCYTISFQSLWLMEMFLMDDLQIAIYHSFDLPCLFPPRSSLDSICLGCHSPLLCACPSHLNILLLSVVILNM